MRHAVLWCAALCCGALQGALLCLAAATVGLGEPSEAYLRQIVPPVLASFTDQDSRVRYYACEALYNIAKVCRGKLWGVAVAAAAQVWRRGQRSHVGTSRGGGVSDSGTDRQDSGASSSSSRISCMSVSCVRVQRLRCSEGSVQ